MENFIKGSGPPLPPIYGKNKVFFSEIRPFFSTFYKSEFSPLKIPKNLPPQMPDFAATRNGHNMQNLGAILALTWFCHFSMCL